ncbi:hypothetical protein HKX48_005752 [Thoreauomyces humboldtii]|nr:hypothetical protein HKX48_005752 [Thoreauomyces humboldtii]
MPPRTAYQLINEELALDGNPVLNLATFVTTYMEPEDDQLIADNISKNFIDAEPWESRPSDPATLALKRKWQLRRKESGKSTERPNMVMGANVQVCWEKAARYLEIEARYVNCDEDHLSLNPEKAIKLVDENTIGVVAILGSTYTGHYEDASAMNDLLLGGLRLLFVAQDLNWDFRLESVASINVSGHKYGLCYAGIGWAVWRSPGDLPEDLVFHISYLGSDQVSFTLNFSKGAAPVISQYYILIRLGKEGFRNIKENHYKNTTYLAEHVVATGWFKLLSDLDPAKGLPLVAFQLVKDEVHHFDEIGRQPKDIETMHLLRVVLREDFSRNRCDLLVADLKAAVEYLVKQDAKSVEVHRASRGKWKTVFDKLPIHDVSAKKKTGASAKIC